MDGADLATALARLTERLDRLHADLGGMRADLGAMLAALTQRTAADEARTALVRDAAMSITGTTWGRALLTVATVRILFGSAADALVLALLSRATGVDVAP